jgi:hypothetical protein
MGHTSSIAERDFTGARLRNFRQHIVSDYGEGAALPPSLRPQQSIVTKYQP